VRSESKRMTAIGDPIAVSCYSCSLRIRYSLRLNDYSARNDVALQHYHSQRREHSVTEAQEECDSSIINISGSLCGLGWP
jgi:hypothetical protein